jgi:DnaJ-class molecular chaperone
MAEPKKLICAEVKLPLHNFLTGCVTTVSIDDTIVEFKVAPNTYPGTLLEFTASNLTTHKVRVKLLEDMSLWYKRVESNIVIYRKINKDDATTGKTVEVINFDGVKHSINIAPNTNVNKMTFQIFGEGFVKSNSQSRGNLTIIIDIEKEGN